MTICFEESETTEHLFFNCKIIHNFWKNLGIFYAGELNDNTFTNIQDDKKTIMFGCVRNDNIMCLKNKIILFTKYYICMCRCKKTKLLLKKFVLFVNFQIKLDETAKLAGN